MDAQAQAGATMKFPVDPVDGVANLDLLIDPQPLVQTGRNWTRWVGPLISALIIVMAAYQLRFLDFHQLAAMLPANLLFWVAFAACYASSPITEWIMFRRIWGLPVEGFAALLRKLVSNEILLGYLGEVYFYAWARRNARVPAAPFGAIKDVTILSALAGNIVTLLLVVIAAPLFGSLHLGVDNTAFLLSIIFVLVTSLAALVLRNRLFTLPRNELWFVASLHFARIIVSLMLSAVMWHLLLPSVGLSWWLLLGTFRQLLSRLPFLPNKDVVFAGLAAFLVGPDIEIVSAMALMATLILAAHLLVGASLGLAELLRESRFK